MADNEPTPQQFEQFGRAAYAEEQQKLLRIAAAAEATIKDGREHFGSKAFDEYSQELVNKLGDKHTAAFRKALPSVQAYAPEVVVHYSQNDRDADELKKLSTDQDVEMHILKTASQFAPHGNVRLAERRVREGRGHYTAADWASGYAQQHCTDAQLDAHIRERWEKKNR